LRDINETVRELDLNLGLIGSEASSALMIHKNIYDAADITFGMTGNAVVKAQRHPVAFRVTLTKKPQ